MRNGMKRELILYFSVAIKRIEKPVRIVFLIEHKSRQDANLLKQLLRYQVDRYSKSNHPIIPILVYHGREKRWRGPLSFHQSLEGLTPTVKKEFGENILSFKCRLLNINEIDIEEKETKDLPFQAYFIYNASYMACERGNSSKII